jgi:uncharacterized protein (DUF2235 family)
MALIDDSPVDKQQKARNIAIFSDGTGQRGGLNFDEERSNVYKLYRATRVGPDSSIDPSAQVSFYDPGRGTLQPGGSTPQRVFRSLYNFISRATGLGITRNIIDCYAAMIRLWRPGDRIFLFGFSRGAYTVRCLASVVCLCGIPTTSKGGKPLKLDVKSTTKIASIAVKSVYQHVSSSRDKKYAGQRRALATRFRKLYNSDPGDPTVPNVYPYFIGVFDTVAALSNTGSLVILLVAYTAVHTASSFVLSIAFPWSSFWFWFGWIAVATASVVMAAYVYTHLKFAVGLPSYFFWDVIHLTTFRQKFYDQYLNRNVKYARHAISIDERRNDFRRVPWGGRHVAFSPQEHKIEPFEQFWFAGNRADIGGGYPENECRLSDIALTWMVQNASDSRLGDEALIIDRRVLHLNGRIEGTQHDEARSSVFRWAKKTLRDPVPDATLHASVPRRFELSEVQQYEVMAPYRPEALRHHKKVAAYFANVPLAHVTCWQRIEGGLSRAKRSTGLYLRRSCGWLLTSIYPKDWAQEQTMDQPKKHLTLDSFVSCIGLLSLVLSVGLALWIFIGWQIFPWLIEAHWNSYPLAVCCSFQTSWIGLSKIIGWLLQLPVTLVLTVLGIFLFWLFGTLSAKIYQCAANRAGTSVTPAQTSA